MELMVFKRNADKKSEKKVIRRTNDIPAVVYGNSVTNENMFVKGAQIEEALRNIPEGRLSTQVFTLVEDNNKFKALVKEIQYHSTTYKIMHIDFYKIDEKKLFNVKVPIECLGAANCVGIKLGGALRRVIRKLKVRCLLKDMPQTFNLDVSKMEVGHAKKLSEIEIPKNVQPLAQMNEIAVTIAKR